MAYSSLATPSAELAALALDKPLFAVKNALRTYNTAPAWFTTRSWLGTQIDEATAPGRWVHDDTMREQTAPSSSMTGAAAHLLFDLDDTAGNEIDMVIIGNHNFAELNGSVDVAVYCADDNTFATNLNLMASWSGVATPDRLVDLSLLHTAVTNRRFSALRYVAISITTSGSFSAPNAQPRIGEVFLGRRRQLARKHDYPGDDQRETSRIDTFESESGYMTNFRRAYGRRDVDLMWTADQADALGLDDQATWRSIWSDSTRGTRPLWYLREPSTTPGDAVLMRMPSPARAFKFLGPNHAEVKFAAVEVPPFLALEGT